MNIAKVGDIVPGICYCVPTPPGPYPDIGVIVSGDPLHIDTGSPVARVGDLVMFSCGSSTIVSGSPLFLSGVQPVARSSDTVVGCGVGTVIGSSISISL